MHSFDVQGEGYGEHPLAALVADLDRDPAGVTAGKPVFTDRGSGLDCLLFGLIKAGELKPILIVHKELTLSNVEVEPGHYATPDGSCVRGHAFRD